MTMLFSIRVIEMGLVFFFCFFFRRDGQSLQRFLEDYFAGRLKRYVKSEPIPEKNNAAVKVR